MLNDPEFQPTRPLQGATNRTHYAQWDLDYFNPRAPCGARPSSPLLQQQLGHFNPRAPCGARRIELRQKRQRQKRFQPTRPLRGATAETPVPAEPAQFQPTRPLRGATKNIHEILKGELISTHAPLAGRDTGGAKTREDIYKFQPTRPLRGATGIPQRQCAKIQNFNPRAPCGARRGGICTVHSRSDFNPRAPCGARLLRP